MGVSLDTADGTAALILAAAGKLAVMDEVTSGLLWDQRSGHYQHFLRIALFIWMPLVSQKTLDVRCDKARANRSKCKERKRIVSSPMRLWLLIQVNAGPTKKSK